MLSFIEVFKIPSSNVENQNNFRSRNEMTTLKEFQVERLACQRL